MKDPLDIVKNVNIKWYDDKYGPKEGRYFYFNFSLFGPIINNSRGGPSFFLLLLFWPISEFGLVKI